VNSQEYLLTSPIDTAADLLENNDRWRAMHEANRQFITAYVAGEIVAARYWQSVADIIDHSDSLQHENDVELAQNSAAA
jgi:hypothetical protein